jgi:hypothetical protein
MKAWLLANVLATVSLVVAIIALFKDRLLLRLFGPRLGLRFDPHRGADLHMTIAHIFNAQTGVVIASNPCLYVRLRVHNSGRSTAEMVEVSIKELHRAVGTSSDYTPDTNFLPLNLKWAHTGRPLRERVPPGSEKYCDLFHIVRPIPPAAISAELDLEVQPATRSGFLEPGRYRLVIEVAASNAKATTFTADLLIPNAWSNDVAGFMQHGFYLTGLPTGMSSAQRETQHCG